MSSSCSLSRHSINEPCANPLTRVVGMNRDLFDVRTPIDPFYKHIAHGLFIDDVDPHPAITTRILKDIDRKRFVIRDRRHTVGGEHFSGGAFDVLQQRRFIWSAVSYRTWQHSTPPVSIGHNSAMDDARQRLRQSFDKAATTYLAARPSYPEKLYQRLLSVCELTPDAKLLEVGCGPGLATLTLARLGYHIDCIEPGENLAEQARRNLTDSHCRVWQEDFEDLSIDPAEYDLVFAATAWQWVDPQVRYAKAAAVLKSGGHLAFWDANHVFPQNGDTIFQTIQPVYDEIGEGLPGSHEWPQPGQLPDRSAEFEDSGLFDTVHVEHFDWEVRYSIDQYIDLLLTFSGHILMEQWQLERLFNALRTLVAQRPEPFIRRHWGCVLHVARKR